jgi:hypothetical protein
MIALRIALAVVSVCFAGCGRGLYDLQATVTLDGQPLGDASVTLHPTGESDGGKRTASGTSDAGGKIRFTTFEPFDGVAAGEYKVVVLKSPKDLDEEFAGMDREDPDVMLRMAQRKTLAFVPYSPTTLPKVYLNPETTPLTIKVPPDEEPVVLKLESSAK